MLDVARTELLLQDFCKSDSNILAVYLFGSQVDGTAHAKSDLDLAVLFMEPLTLWQELEFQAKVSTAIRYEAVDLLNLNKAPLRMQFTVLSTGRLIYEADSEKTSDYIETVLLRYHDRAYREKRFFAEWDEGLKEDYLNGQSE